MQLVSRKNFLLFLAAILVVALGFMAITLSKETKRSKSTQFDQEIRKVERQSQSDEVDAIEKDLNATDLDDVDKELQDIGNELNQSY